MKNNILGAYLMPHPPIIIDKIGRGEEKKAEKTIEGMERISRDIKKKSPKNIILITPHGPLFSDAIAISSEEALKGNFNRFGFNELRYSFENNLNLVEEIVKNSMFEDINVTKIDKSIALSYNVEDELDHGALVPLHFINNEYDNFNLIHITYGLLPPKDLYKFGKVIQRSIDRLGASAVIIASGDLSHKLSDDGPYGYSPFGEEFDEKIIDTIRSGDLKDLITFDLNLSEKAGECGLRSLMIMTGALDGYELETSVLSYEGPFGVGYGTAIIDIAGTKDGDLLNEVELNERKTVEQARNHESPYVSLARKSLEHFIRTHKYLDVKDESHIRKGVFVTLKKDGNLRGCIGTTEPVTNSIEEEIIENAVSAGTKDSRFTRVEEEELDSIIYSVDVLEKSELVENLDELDVNKYGVIVSKGIRRGLLLPNLDGVDRVEDQISIALSKANIDPGEDYHIEKFKVTRYN